MRRLLATAAAFLVLLTATSTSAEGFNNLMGGINGVFTAPLDPVWSVVDPPEYIKVFGDPVTPHVIGIGHGVLMLAYRATVGALDIFLFPFWVFPTFSPEARYDIWLTYDVEYE